MYMYFCYAFFISFSIYLFIILSYIILLSLSLLNNLIVSEYIKPVVANTRTIIQSENAKGTKSNIS